ncbi:hypothetical protein [Streptomyces sp. NPDC018833]|uniref:hypothetical protein n=1 Tax=Streptomyces sp. NPDC018833 TaxID=3365053 RepID=UPI0037900CAF
MNRLARSAVTGVVILLAVPLAAGCGRETAGAAGASPTPSVDYQAQARAAKAEHDRKFPDVATICSDPAPSATAKPSPPELPDDPEARKYAENHAYKQRGTLTADARCRGDAHARRIARGLKGVQDEAALRPALDRLGYPSEWVEVFTAGGAPVFVFSIPDAGPCITGSLTDPVTVEAHGHYVEGGCTEPKGGH